MEATGKGEKIPYNAVVQQKVDSFVGQKIICLLIKMWRGPALYIEETNEAAAALAARVNLQLCVAFNGQKCLISN